MNFSKKVRHTYIMGGRWVSSGPDWVLFKHHSLTIKLHKIIYMSMSKNQWVHKIPNKTILHGGTMNFSKKARHTCNLWGGEVGEIRPRLGALQ